MIISPNTVSFKEREIELTNRNRKSRKKNTLEGRASRFSAGSSSRTFPRSEIESAPKGLETGIKEPEASDGKHRVHYIGRGLVSIRPTRDEREREGWYLWRRRNQAIVDETTSATITSTEVEARFHACPPDISWIKRAFPFRLAVRMTHIQRGLLAVEAFCSTRDESLPFSLSFSNRKNTRTNPVIRMFHPVSSGKRNYSSFIINLEWEDIVVVKYLKIVNMLLRLPLMFLNETISSKIFPIYIQEQI